MIEKYKKIKQNHFLFILLTLTIISMAVMRYLDSFLINDVSQNGIVSFELAKDISRSTQIMESWDSYSKTAAGISMGFDFLFLIFYSSFLSMLLFKLNDRLFTKTNHKRLSIIIISIPLIAALFDVVENVALIKLLLGDFQQKWTTMAYYFAISKFGLLTLAIAYILVSILVLTIRKKE